MAHHYRKLPSEILRLSDEVLAYRFDEVCFYYEGVAIQDDGSYDWNLINWKNKNKKKNTRVLGSANQGFIDFIKKEVAKNGT